MSVEARAIPAPHLAVGAGPTRSFGLARWHEHPRVIAAATTLPGRLAVALAATGLLYWHAVSAAALPAVWLVALVPRFRRELLGLGALLVALRFLQERAAGTSFPLPAGSWLPLVAATAMLFGLCLMVQRAATRFDALPAPLRNHPIVALQALVWAGIALVWIFPGVAPLRAVALMLPPLSWRLGYLLLSGRRGTARGTRFRDHLFYLFPLWGGSVPYGKGRDELGRRDARDAGELAASRLAGLQLLFLAAAWFVALGLIDGLVYAAADAPDWLVRRAIDLPTIVELANGTRGAALPLQWCALAVELIHQTLQVAVFGHVAVGLLRLFGFNVLRSTDRPLLAESIVEFWGRFFLYFKELLVDFFFYPTYLRWFRSRPALRLFVAVFAAACFGNMYFHLLREKALLQADFAYLWAMLGPRFFYCALLATGIAVSMLRQQRARASARDVAWPARLRRVAGVWLFFGVIQIWNVHAPALGFTARCEFCLSLLGF